MLRYIVSLNIEDRASGKMGDQVSLTIVHWFLEMINKRLFIMGDDRALPAMGDERICFIAMCRGSSCAGDSRSVIIAVDGHDRNELRDASILHILQHLKHPTEVVSV